MNGCERMMTAVRRGQPDRVPIWELIINRPVIEALQPDLFADPERARAYDEGSHGGYLLQADFIEREELDGITVFEDTRVRKWINDTSYVDEWGITWELPSYGIPYAVGHPIRSESDLAKLKPPDPDADDRLESLQAAVERFKGERAIVFLGHDAFEFSHYLRGMDTLLIDYMLNPGFAQRLARVVMDYKKRVLERAAAVGADILLTGDDYADRQGPMMSPALFRDFILPYLQEAVDVAKRAGVPFIKHTDGNLWKILDLIVDTGIDALDPLEPMAAMDMGRVKEDYGDRIALAGNVDCGRLLPQATKGEVVEAVKETLAKGAVGGGLVLASSNSIHPAVKPANYRAMVEAGRRYGRYPLDPQMIENYRERNYMAKYTKSR